MRLTNIIHKNETLKKYQQEWNSQKNTKLRLTKMFHILCLFWAFLRLPEAIKRCFRSQCCNEASKIFFLRRILAKDPSSSSSLAHFQKSENLRSFEDFKPKIPKSFGKNLHSFGKNCPTNS